MAVKLLNEDDRIEVVCESDKGEDKTVFVLRPLLFKDKIKIASLSAELGEKPTINDEILEIMYNCVVEIKNVFVGNEKRNYVGEEIKEKRIIEKLPLEIVAELFGKIVEYNFLGEEDKKK